MLLWGLAILFLAGAAAAGKRHGGIRAGLTLLGLVLASCLAMPFSEPVKFLLTIFGLKHPAVVAWVGPAVVFILVVAIAKACGMSLHNKADRYYKYKVSETHGQLWERLNQRTGISLGLANGAVYFFALTLVIYLLGYWTIQLVTSPKDSFWLRTLNVLARDVQRTGMTKALAPFVPVGESYFEQADVAGIAFHNPLVQHRLSSYPTLVTLAERKEFQDIATDVEFQQLWASQPSFRQFINHARIKPVVENMELYTNILALATPDITDLKEYLLTGQSAKYGEERILGRWAFDFGATMTLARQRPNITTVELKKIRNALAATIVNGTFTATVDQRAIIRGPGGVSEGTWRSEGGGNYILALTEGGKNLEATVAVEKNRLRLTKDGLTLVFEK